MSSERFGEGGRCEGSLGRPGDAASAGPGNVGVAGPSKPEPEEEERLAPRPERRGGCVIYLSGDAIGSDPSGGRALMRAFLYALTEIAPQPSAILIVGSAVRLAQPGSEVLESLSLMHEQGVRVLVDEQSIGHEGGVAVGKAVTPHTILQALLQAEKVISL